MKIFLTVSSFLALSSLILFGMQLLGAKKDNDSQLAKVAKLVQDGDIIFQTSQSRQSKAIQLATHSKYSHMGIIYLEAGQPYVYEAIQQVKATPLKQWIERGEGGKFVVKRLRNASEVLTPATLRKMKKAGSKYNGKNYDIYFEWSNDKIYCLELVWKIYKEGAGIEIGTLQKLKDFDLSHTAVKKIMRGRYGNKIPLEEKVISPVRMFEAEELVVVE